MKVLNDLGWKSSHGEWLERVFNKRYWMREPLSVMENFILLLKMGIVLLQKMALINSSLSYLISLHWGWVNSRECSAFQTICLMSHSLETLLKVLHGRTHSTIELDITDTQFSFRNGVATREALFTFNVFAQKCCSDLI